MPSAGVEYRCTPIDVQSAGRFNLPRIVPVARHEDLEDVDEQWLSLRLPFEAVSGEVCRACSSRSFTAGVTHVNMDFMGAVVGAVADDTTRNAGTGAGVGCVKSKECGGWCRCWVRILALYRTVM